MATARRPSSASMRADVLDSDAATTSCTNTPLWMRARDHPDAPPTWPWSLRYHLSPHGDASAAGTSGRLRGRMRPARLASATLMIVVTSMLGACTAAGRSDVADAPAPATPPTPAAALRSADPVTVATGCPAADATVTTVVGRPLVVRAPPTDRRRPAVLVLHGFTGSPAAAEHDSGLTPAAMAGGVLVAYPQGEPLPDGGGYGWNSGAGIYAVDLRRRRRSGGGDDRPPGHLILRRPGPRRAGGRVQRRRHDHAGAVCAGSQRARHRRRGCHPGSRCGGDRAGVATPHCCPGP